MIKSDDEPTAFSMKAAAFVMPSFLRSAAAEERPRPCGRRARKSIFTLNVGDAVLGVPQMGRIRSLQSVSVKNGTPRTASPTIFHPILKKLISVFDGHVKRMNEQMMSMLA